MSTFTDDLKFAQTTNVCARVRLLDGETITTGVFEVNEEEGWVSLFEPETFGDETTRRRIALDRIGSVTVTDIAWGSG